MEEEEEPIERRIHQSDEYYQENTRRSRTVFTENLPHDTLKYDIDEYDFFFFKLINQN